MDKLGRNFLLIVQSDDANGTLVTIKPPFTVEFDITRSQFSSANVATIRIYNLGKNTRAQIRKDRFDGGNLKQVIFQAGYGTSLSTLLNGNVTQAWSVREGNNFITTIQAFEAGFAYVNAIVNQQFPSGTPQSTIITSVVDSLKQYNVSPGAIGSFPGSTSRGTSLVGSATSQLAMLTGGGFFIDAGKAHCLNDNEALDNEVIQVNAMTGLLGTPVREETYFNFDMLFEPRLVIGALIQLKTTTGEDFNGICRVNSLHHRGVISPVVSGEALTSVGSLAGTFTPIKSVTS